MTIKWLNVMAISFSTALWTWRFKTNTRRGSLTVLVADSLLDRYSQAGSFAGYYMWTGPLVGMRCDKCGVTWAYGSWHESCFPAKNANGYLDGQRSGIPCTETLRLL